MYTFNQFLEEVSANAVGGGNVAGLGVGTQGEPPVKLSSKKIKPKGVRRIVSVKYLKSNTNVRG